MLVFIGIVSTSSALAAYQAGSAHEADMPGTWRVEPSTFAVVVRAGAAAGNFTGTALVINRDRSFVATNIADYHVVGPPPSMPSNLVTFALTLRKDGTFTATNVPAGLFFDWPATAEATGRWSLKTNEVPTAFMLSFKKPSFGFLGWSVVWLQKDSLSSRELALHVAIGESNDRQFCLTKQFGSKALDAARGFVMKSSSANGGGAANRSQPFRSETNRTSSAAGSSR
jgi:hypothetical protein